MLQVNTMAAFPRTQILYRTVVYTAFTVVVSLLSGWFACDRAMAEPAPRTTLVIFADHRVPDEEWTDLSAALRRAQTSSATSTPALSGEMEIVRGDQMKPGLGVSTVITVFLRGDCRLMPRPRLVVQGALGWVPRSKGIIGPFVTVNCSRIVDMLGPLALGMDSSRRDVLMAEALARVIVHEWVHIATQSASHGKQGVTQSVFGLRDLLADDVEVQRGTFRTRI